MKNPSDQLTILQSVVMMADGVLSPILSPTSSIPSDTASQRSRLSSCSVPSADLLASARHVDFDRHSSDGHNRRLFSRSVDGGLSVCVCVCVCACVYVHAWGRWVLMLHLHVCMYKYIER